MPARRRAAEWWRETGVDLACLAVQFSVAQPGIATNVVGTVGPELVRRAIRAAEEPLDTGSSPECGSCFGRARGTSSPAAAPRTSNSFYPPPHAADRP